MNPSLVARAVRSILLAVRPALEVVPSGCRCCALESKVEAAYSGGAAAAVTGSRKVSVENVVPLAACSGHDTRQLLEGGGGGGGRCHLVFGFDIPSRAMLT